MAEIGEPLIARLNPPANKPPIKHAPLTIKRTNKPRKTNPIILPALILEFVIFYIFPFLFYRIYQNIECPKLKTSIYKL
jgi:hypothetical protein